MIRSSWSHTLDEELNHQRDTMRRLGFTEDYREGVAAFLEKRQAISSAAEPSDMDPVPNAP